MHAVANLDTFYAQ